MPQVNPDPHDKGYVYQPTHAVTGDFPAGVDVQAVQRALVAAGFGAEQVQIFQGEAGADQLDLKGERHGGWVQFRRALEQLFADETMVFDRAEELLRSGGVVVVAFTGGDAALKDQAVDVLKSHGGQPVRYWGEWTVDRP
ncbi:hypothetical protein V5E97_29175 [Singulisphaera sp. Ch08]|uniref:Uncharacterized protein n=1 Tax=Singulisphaera sp. Ch08 TaxID=3120278 RepID=A0AAU7CB87_9BACT